MQYSHLLLAEEDDHKKGKTDDCLNVKCRRKGFTRNNVAARVRLFESKNVRFEVTFKHTYFCHESAVQVIRQMRRVRLTQFVYR